MPAAAALAYNGVITSERFTGQQCAYWDIIFNANSSAARLSLSATGDGGGKLIGGFLSFER
jgi:hypothetical protein